jgi:hypothetical protein
MFRSSHLCSFESASNFEPWNTNKSSQPSVPNSNLYALAVNVSLNPWQYLSERVHQFIKSSHNSIESRICVRLLLFNSSNQVTSVALHVHSIMQPSEQCLLKKQRKWNDKGCFVRLVNWHLDRGPNATGRCTIDFSILLQESSHLESQSFFSSKTNFDRSRSFLHWNGHIFLKDSHQRCPRSVFPTHA